MPPLRQLGDGRIATYRNPAPSVHDVLLLVWDGQRFHEDQATLKDWEEAKPWRIPGPLPRVEDKG